MKKFKWQGRANLERPRVEGEAISVDEHPQGCQGDEEPASEGGKVDELVDLSGEYHHHHQGVLETDNTAMVTYSCGDVVTSKAPFTCTVHHFPSFIVFLANMSPTRWLSLLKKNRAISKLRKKSLQFRCWIVIEIN